MSRKKDGWVPASFMISTTEGDKWKTGEVRGYFGIYGIPFNFTLTHLPTGYRCDNVLPYTVCFTKKNLKKWAEVLDKRLGDKWRFKNPEKAAKLISRKKAVELAENAFG